MKKLTWQINCETRSQIGKKMFSQNLTFLIFWIAYGFILTSCCARTLGITAENSDEQLLTINELGTAESTVKQLHTSRELGTEESTVKQFHTIRELGTAESTVKQLHTIRELSAAENTDQQLHTIRELGTAENTDEQLYAIRELGRQEPDDSFTESQEFLRDGFKLSKNTLDTLDNGELNHMVKNSNREVPEKTAPHLPLLSLSKPFQPSTCLILNKVGKQMDDELIQTQKEKYLNGQNVHINTHFKSTSLRNRLEIFKNIIYTNLTSGTPIYSTDSESMSNQLNVEKTPCQTSSNYKDYSLRHFDQTCYENLHERINDLFGIFNISNETSASSDYCNIYQNKTLYCTGSEVREVPVKYHDSKFDYVIFDKTQIYYFDKADIEQLPHSRVLAMLNGNLVRIEPKYLQDRVSEELIISNNKLSSLSFSSFYNENGKHSNISVLHFGNNLIHFLVSKYGMFMTN